MNRPDNGASTAARQQMAAALAAGSSSEWSDAFASVPRHLFVPRFYRQGTNGTWQPIAWGEPGYLEAVYSDAALTTQLDDRGVPTSSSSQPSIMLSMLQALDAAEGHRVFELGTGTGYNLGLLAHRLGDTNVTSVDIDPGLIETAVRNLQQAGFSPTVAVGDGAQGYPSRAPYDRIISTVGVHMIPQPLLQQAPPARSSSFLSATASCGPQSPARATPLAGSWSHRRTSWPDAPRVPRRSSRRRTSSRRPTAACRRRTCWDG
ncbi:methyltransferase domain-containing protein [Streptomyces maoxianensis]|uniref:Protein-L-isoaspartate O-methyltransferase n=1 Tax=Streptomyces maoxianensis TaxID=1459942 RepID=A0ABV9GFG6_9ACTN